MGFAQKIYRYWYYTRLGYSQLTFLFAFGSFLLLIKLTLNLTWAVLIIVGLSVLPVITIGGWWFVKGINKPHMTETKIRAKYNAAMQMQFHFWSAFLTHFIDPVPDSLINLLHTLEKCKQEWLLDDY